MKILKYNKTAAIEAMRLAVFAPKIEALEKKRTVISDRIARKIVKKYAAALKKLPAGCVHYYGSVTAVAEQGDEVTYTTRERKLNETKIVFYPKSVRVPHLNGARWIISQEDYGAIEEAEKAVKVATRDQRDTIRQLERALNHCRTYDAACKVWPDFKKYHGGMQPGKSLAMLPDVSEAIKTIKRYAA